MPQKRYPSRPKRSVKRTKFTKRTKRTKRRNVINRTMVKAGLGFPKKMLMTHKYVQSQVVGAAAATLGVYNFCANGMYDPYLTGTGHQPMYFDQMTALYNHYTVIGSKIKVTLVPADQNYVVGILLNDDTTTLPASWDAAAEQSLANSKVVLVNAVRPTFITSKWSAKKVFGGSVLANDELQGSALANPVEQSVYTVSFQTLDKITAVSSIFIKFEIEYIAVWRELKEVAQS